jgi:hypothetical protein
MSTLVKLRRSTEEFACEVVTRPVVLLAPYEGATSLTIYKVVGDVGQVRVQIPVNNSDMVLHVEIGNTGDVTVYTRTRKWSDKPEFQTLYKINVPEELQMKRLAR